MFEWTRRRFAQNLLLLGGLSILEPFYLYRALATERKRLSSRAYRTAEFTGTRLLGRIDGAVPKDLLGTLYRVGPGQKDNHGTRLNHFFDGDAYLARFRFTEAGVELTGAFFDSPGRAEEIAAGRMLYDEFGTRAPVADADRRGLKNQPSVNVIEWDSVLLGLSEGGHPTALRPADLGYLGEWDFHGTLPANVTFSAHPKFDPKTGDGFGHGIEQIIGRDGLTYALKVYRMERATGTLRELYSVPLDGYSMIHDLTMSENHLVFMIPAVSFDIPALIAGNGPVADYLKYVEKTPTRILILNRDGSTVPRFVEQPPSTLFHHGNAFEENGSLFYDTMLGPDGSLLRLLADFSKDHLTVPTTTTLTRFEISLAPSPGFQGRTDLGIYEDFPRFDLRRTGQKARYLYTLEANSSDDPLANIAIVKHDFTRQNFAKISIAGTETWGEPVFVPRADSTGEDQGWLLALGYDSVSDQTFLEIRDAETLEFQARVWTGVFFPLGFHGNFYEA